VPSASAASQDSADSTVGVNHQGMTESIHTDRLDLIPMTPAFLRASMERNHPEAERELRLSLPTDWPGETADVLSLRLRALEEEPALQPWLLRAMAHRATGVMVGHIGFHTAPDAEYLQPYVPGGVEFGFTVFPSFRRQGFAREASVGLMRWARHSQGVRRFAMTIRPDNHPSQALAAQLGFVRIGSHIDEVDGHEDILACRDSTHYTA
jgi:ribosomal-protein-alanine N-acetyltransferase